MDIPCFYQRELVCTLDELHTHLGIPPVTFRDLFKPAGSGQTSERASNLYDRYVSFLRYLFECNSFFRMCLKNIHNAEPTNQLKRG